MEHDGDKSEEDDDEEEIKTTPVDVPAQLTFFPVEDIGAGDNAMDINITDIRKFKDKHNLYPVAEL